ncbi:DUF6221 family protein (plasmid) [Streptomyces sp. NBC_01723]|uniref:DUF6221 family protein n=1 Tax=Streptomyces sp. NBC_01723 TaxID=2975921 RepID=UPI002E33EBA2|nr:DUF6221 family protein [Streptomyces sp. NBC_01723]
MTEQKLETGHSMSSLVKWLHAQFNWDAAVARCACHLDEGQWRQDDPQRFQGLIVDDRNETVVRDEGMLSEQRARHVALHDPARVLREIDVKRQIVRQAFEHAATIDGEWGCCHDAEAIEAGYCEEQRPNDLRLLRLLALPYADRAGYREEWRP